MMKNWSLSVNFLMGLTVYVFLYVALLEEWPVDLVSEPPFDVSRSPSPIPGDDSLKMNWYPKYRFGNEPCSYFFFPVHSLDRLIRPSKWTTEFIIPAK